ncbi:hypothetical protein GGX14DRAFT_387128 [Mycena pura]|uniref:Uncharacterized protein n=1 Tax=Mycena pura TaxID=153505 RepID=A0AAD6YN62_9AGAR|nr:hypothetical protein GGX14DRAFT_387128 [Mycena pura]
MTPIFCDFARSPNLRPVYALRTDSSSARAKIPRGFCSPNMVKDELFIVRTTTSSVVMFSDAAFTKSNSTCCGDSAANAERMFKWGFWGSGETRQEQLSLQVSGPPEAPVHPTALDQNANPCIIAATPPAHPSAVPTILLLTAPQARISLPKRIGLPPSYLTGIAYLISLACRKHNSDMAFSSINTGSLENNSRNKHLKQSSPEFMYFLFGKVLAIIFSVAPERLHYDCPDSLGIMISYCTTGTSSRGARLERELLQQVANSTSHVELQKLKQGELSSNDERKYKTLIRQCDREILGSTHYKHPVSSGGKKTAEPTHRCSNFTGASTPRMTDAPAGPQRAVAQMADERSARSAPRGASSASGDAVDVFICAAITDQLIALKAKADAQDTLERAEPPTERRAHNAHGPKVLIHRWAYERTRIRGVAAKDMMSEGAASASDALSVFRDEDEGLDVAGDATGTNTAPGFSEAKAINLNRVHHTSRAA